MNRSLAPIKGTLYRGLVLMPVRLDITASTGAVATTSTALGGAATPFTRESAGLYRFYPNEPFVGPAFAQVSILKGTAEDLDVEIVANQLTAATPYVSFRTKVAAGTATDATNACSVHLLITAVDSAGNP
jgi:hypothetical protein